MAEKRYVERDAVDQMLNQNHDMAHGKQRDLIVWLMLAFRDLVPDADVRPAVMGQYIGEADGYADGELVYDMWSCSVCGCRFEDWDEKPTYNFCPNCGADMREP